MGGSKLMAGKRRRAARSYTEHERYMHKSSTLLQREGKKIRGFLVQKAVQQLKQTREQYAQAQKASAQAHDSGDEKRIKRAAGKEKKLFHQLERLEREHVLLKGLDLKAIVTRAFEQTGLQEEEEEADNDSAMGDGESDEGRTIPGTEDDDGFNSEDYDDCAPGEDEEEAASSSDEEDGGEGVQAHTESPSAPKASTISVGADDAAANAPSGVESGDVPESSSASGDTATISVLVDRVLAHKQMQPFLEAIKAYVEKKNREDAKKQRLKEKKALKRSRENLIGGRSARAPTSMFFGSLAGDDGDAMDAYSGGISMAGAEDDIAEFLGETKKKKNRPGQMARRQKAMRMEEARRREDDRAKGIFKRRPSVRDNGLSKYGPSERPKKAPRREDKPRQPQQQVKHVRPAARNPVVQEKRPVQEDKPPQRSTAPPQSKRKPEPAPSHPSWVAKQAQKEKEKAGLSGFAGKKITFGDD